MRFDFVGATLREAIVLLYFLLGYAVEFFFGKGGKGFPAEVQGLLYCPVFVGSLRDELLFEYVSELQVLLIQGGEFFFTDDRRQVAYVFDVTVGGEELASQMGMVVPGAVFADAVFHESRKGRKPGD